jgi:excinuclease ABC subunit A
VIVVEHDEDAIRTADHVVDIGPGAGVHGGEIVAEGTPGRSWPIPKSLTGKYLTGARRSGARQTAANPTQSARSRCQGARGNNLKNVSPKSRWALFTCVTGVSGGGKSTFHRDALQGGAAQAERRAREPAEPMTGSTGWNTSTRSSTSTSRPSAARRAPTRPPIPAPSRRSATGSPACRKPRRAATAGPLLVQRQGRPLRGLPGRRRHQDRDALPARCLRDLRRVPRQALQPRDAGHQFKGKSIADVLDMTVEEGASSSRRAAVRDKLVTLERVGLGYIKVGQQATTLSGGEAQRVKLAKELSKRSTGRTLYILDEPTTGLHFPRCRQAAGSAARAGRAGQHVVVIEHNLEVIKTADWIIDLGPEGGDGGGEIVPRTSSRSNAATPASSSRNCWNGVPADGSKRRNRSSTRDRCTTDPNHSPQFVDVHQWRQ